MGVGIIGPVSSGGGGGKTMRIERITSTGTWTVPDDVTEIEVWLAGGGASGTAWSNDPSPGGGGSADFRTLSVTPGSVHTITIGGGGSRVNSQSAGNPGGTSSFGNLFSVSGGDAQTGDQGPAGGNFGGSGYRGQSNAFYTYHYVTGEGVNAFGYEIGAGGASNFYNNSSMGGGRGAGQRTRDGSTNGAPNSGAGGLGGYGQSASNTSAGGSGVCIIRYWSSL